jgi:Domain of unknown function (DUF6772)
MREHEAMRSALLRTDPLLSKYDPLERLLIVNDFDKGFHGWQTYFPDYDGWEDYPERYPFVEPLGEIIARSRNDAAMRVDRRLPLGPRSVPMLSSITSWDLGTYGSWDGTYALKIPTLAQAGSIGFAVKRLTSPFVGKLRFEAYFTYKSEPSDFKLGETDVRAFFLAFDVMDLHNVRREGLTPVRWWPGIRYHNAEDGKLIGKWQANFTGSVGVHYGPWEYLSDGRQDLGFNRSPTKFQWHYLRFTFDTAKREYVDLHCFGQEFDVAGRKHVMDPPLIGWRGSTDKCPGLIGANFGIETNSDKRAFLYLDSVVVSAEAT